MPPRWCPPLAYRFLAFVSVTTCLLLVTVVEGATRYQLQESYVGPDAGDVFSKWNFFTDPDPTHGYVEYVDYTAALNEGLAKVTEKGIYLGVDMTSKTGEDGRRSVRVESKEVYNGGLFVVRIEHAPSGCGLWPALWMYGNDVTHPWPTWGEYDILEYIHTASQAMTSLHTTAQCDQSGVAQGEQFMGSWAVTGDENSVVSDNCDVRAPDQPPNSGCSQLGPEGSIGTAFNAGGGGTYVAEWDPEAKHFRTWFFGPGEEPFDLTSGTPHPEFWAKPFSYYTMAQGVCNASHFKNMRLVIDTTFCGDLGDPFFSAMCPDVSKDTTCSEYVSQHPEAMHEAYWHLSGLDVFQKVQVQVPPPVPPQAPPSTTLNILSFPFVAETPQTTARPAAPEPPAPPFSPPTEAPTATSTTSAVGSRSPAHPGHGPHGADLPGEGGPQAKLKKVQVIWLIAGCSCAVLAAVVIGYALKNAARRSAKPEEASKVKMPPEVTRRLAMFEDSPSLPDGDDWGTPFQAGIAAETVQPKSYSRCCTPPPPMDSQVDMSTLAREFTYVGRSEYDDEEQQSLLRGPNIEPL